MAERRYLRKKQLAVLGDMFDGELEEADLIYGAKAQELLMSEDADYVAFWQEITEKYPNNADAQQALGRIYLFMENIDEAKSYYQKAIDLDPSKNALYLDLGRYYMMMAMQNPDLIDSVAPFIEVKHLITYSYAIEIRIVPMA